MCSSPGFIVDHPSHLSFQTTGPRFRPTTTVIRLLFIAAADAKSEAAIGILHSLAEQYRDSQVESIDDDSVFQVDDPVERQRVSQKVAIYESLMEKHPDAISLCATCIQKQFSALIDMDKRWQDDAASPIVRAIAEMYREVAIKVSLVPTTTTSHSHCEISSLSAHVSPPFQPCSR
jgi:hypothetical protein